MNNELLNNLVVLVKNQNLYVLNVVVRQDVNKLISELNTKGMNFVKVVDVSMLSTNENRGHSIVLLIGIVLNPSYIFRLSSENIVD